MPCATIRPLCRRALLALPFALAACGEEEAPPVAYAPLSYDYLPKLRLKVGRIEIDDSWVPRGGARHVEFLAPVQPRDALRQMAQDRLVADGTQGAATFVIEDASIIRAPAQLNGRLAVRLDITDDSGARLGSATARVLQVRPLGDDTEASLRDVLDRFVRAMMQEMNVNFEYELRRTLKATLEPTSTTAPEPGPVQSEDLGQPGAESASPNAPSPDETAPTAPPSGTPQPTPPAPDAAPPGSRMPTRLTPLGAPQD